MPRRMGDKSTVTQIGPHRLMVGDLTQGAVAELMGDEKADVVYTDPPWGPGNQQYWHTMRERGSSPRTSWPEFLNHLVRTVVSHSKAEAPIFVEMGMRWVDELDHAMASMGVRSQRRWLTTYGPKSKALPVWLNLYGTSDVQVEMPDPPHGEPVTRAVLEAVMKPGMVVLDPCTGLGMTARCTHKLGGAFRGTEMNAARLDRTIEWLRRRA